MEANITNATEYRNVPLSILTESKTNPRPIFATRRSWMNWPIMFPGT